jgi:hypothetical protein
MLWPSTITVHLHDVIETKGMTKKEVPALCNRVHEIIAAPIEAGLEKSPE